MTSADLVHQLRAAGDPLHRLAADALVVLATEVEHLQERVYQLEGVARLNVETIRSMQRAAAQIANAQWSRPNSMNSRATINNNGEDHGRRQSRSFTETR